MNFLDQRVPTRIWDKLQPCPTTGCWLWTGATTLQGYGRLWTGDGTAMAHRHIYETLVGPVARELDVDHLCRTPLCCNPLHLEPVTHAENIRRAGGMAQARAASATKAHARTHCKNGHALTRENTHVSSKGYRRCRACHADTERARRAAATGAPT